MVDAYTPIRLVYYSPDKNKISMDINNDGEVDYSTEFLPVMQRALGQFDWKGNDIVTNGVGESKEIPNKYAVFCDAAVKEDGMPSDRDADANHKGYLKPSQFFNLNEYIRGVFDYIHDAKWHVRKYGYPYDGVKPPKDKLNKTIVQAYLGNLNPNWLKMS